MNTEPTENTEPTDEHREREYTMHEHGQEDAAREPQDDGRTEAPELAGGRDVFGRRARILAGLTMGAVVVTAVATGDPTPTMASWA
ncbi:hypothetical protein [Streptomyces sp. NPDC014734]|uniref:hypothetical protein n=1 Tax=Streptomyces sp. NPDC014734 TaxID=3364886 RepID=UPI0036FEA776